MAKQPPKNALRFLRWFCREDYLEEIEGDLIELFEQEYERAPRRANWYFVRQVLWHFRPDFIRSFNRNPNLQGAMLRHNLLISWRGFMRHKSSFFINLTGLSTGLACVFLICLWVYDEIRIDKFLEHDEQIYQVLQTVDSPTGRETIEATPGPLAGALEDEIPEIQFAVSVIPATFNVGKGVIAVEDNRLKAAGQYASPDFFRVFPYPLLQGNSEELFTQKNHVVISEALAVNLFQNPENALGKTLDWQTESISGSCVVSGVFADLPATATDQFDLVLNYDWYLEYFPQENWANSSPRSFVRLQENVPADPLRSKVSAFLDSKIEDSNATLSLQRYSDRYLYNRYENGQVAGGRIEYVRLFLIIALFILVIACVNFMNLSTAKASTKVKEVGVKKVVGAGRGQLVLQYLSESMLVAFLSFLVALLLIVLFIPQFNKLTGKALQLGLAPGLLLGLLGITLLTGLLAGTYPAFFLSGHRAVAVLKGRVRASVGELWVRKGLILFQFAISTLLIVSVIVVYRQIDFIQSGTQLGYNRDHVIYFDVEQPGASFTDDLKRIPGVTSVGGGNLKAGKQLGGTNAIDWEGKSPDNQTFFSTFWLGYGLLETLDIQMVDGQPFSESFGSPDQVILNEEAVRQMGLKEPMNKRILVNGDERQIVGVVEDFHFESFYETVKPCVLLLAPLEYAPRLSLKIQAGLEQETIAQVRSVYEAYYPGLVFDFKFMDEDYQQLYISERRVAVLSRYFAALAIIISCLGLLGLAMFAADRRRKEIGIRKVLGASVFGVIKILTGDFTKVVALAIVVALPISYWLAANWLNRFHLHIDLEWWYFLLPAILVMTIAWLTIGLQTLRAARVDPVRCLKE
ncbi:ABC transporter permease [Flavilitoribacter nigricans]|uniref:Transporter permease n=1 Tax=Flavilitoribacter nigricans (strain ATCC 23147 / DSM 23189 / NBRC 102662 / NCIMB 1420 / SS-2) TaxID=1122177 RepID=A0A2D0N9X4_FLAN2|nr:ABC transporter permease [Flavilitoribacter nigricans]PHN05277.1 transporter permease [Flavilitoribacter nigricans DSM 23189 = NBRC 102662]